MGITCEKLEIGTEGAFVRRIKYCPSGAKLRERNPPLRPFYWMAIWMVKTWLKNHPFLLSLR